jgi:hypothetical protein
MTRTDEFLGETISKEDRLSSLQENLQRMVTQANMFGLQSEVSVMLEKTLMSLQPQEVKE